MQKRYKIQFPRSDAQDLAQDEALIINMSGRGDKDIFTIAHAFDDPSWKEFIVDRAEEYRKAKG